MDLQRAEVRSRKSGSFVGYSEIVHNFIDDGYIFEESNKDMELTRYVWLLGKDSKELRKEKGMIEVFQLAESNKYSEEEQALKDFLRVRNTGHAAKYYVEDSHPAIIDKEEFVA